MTLPQYIDEVKLRAIRLMVALDMDDSEIIMFVNQALQDVQRLTISSHAHRYGKIVNLTNVVIDTQYSVARPYGLQNPCNIFAAQLPVDFIEAYAVLFLSSEDDAIISEARRYDLRELYTVGMHSWNVPTRYRPIYSVADNYPLFAPQTTILFSRGSGWNMGDTIQVWYTAAIQGLDLYDAGFNYGADNDITIATELQELVILYALRSVMQRMEATAALASVAMQTQILEQAFTAGYQTEQLKVTSLLPSQGAI